MKFFGRTTAHNPVQIKIITPDYTYYRIALPKLRHEYNYCLNTLFEFFIIFGRITAYNFVQINTTTPDYARYKIVQLKLRYEYSL